MSPAEEVIKYANMLNTENLSALRSGNISIRYNNGFLITPSGVKYSSLKSEDIVFVSLDGKFEENKLKPSSEWRFHKDIYVNKTEANVMYFFIQSSPDNDINIILKRCNKDTTIDSEHTLLLNKDIERFIMNRPADYSWEYKRFKRSKNLPNNFYKDT